MEGRWGEYGGKMAFTSVFASFMPITGSVRLLTGFYVPFKFRVNAIRAFHLF